MIENILSEYPSYLFESIPQVTGSQAIAKTIPRQYLRAHPSAVSLTAARIDAEIGFASQGAQSSYPNLAGLAATTISMQLSGRILGHGGQLFAGPEVLKILARVARGIIGAAKGAQVASKVGRGSCSPERGNSSAERVVS